MNGILLLGLKRTLWGGDVARGRGQAVPSGHQVVISANLAGGVQVSGIWLLTPLSPRITWASNAGLKQALIVTRRVRRIGKAYVSDQPTEMKIGGIGRNTENEAICRHLYRLRPYIRLCSADR